MGFFSDDSDQAQASSQYDQYANHPEHKAKLSHELIGGAAAFEAAKAYEDHVAKNGAPPSHALAKELFAGFAGAFVDREFESKGLDEYDHLKDKRSAAKEHAADQFDSYQS